MVIYPVDVGSCGRSRDVVYPKKHGPVVGMRRHKLKISTLQFPPEISNVLKKSLL